MSREIGSVFDEIPKYIGIQTEDKYQYQYNNKIQYRNQNKNHYQNPNQTHIQSYIIQLKHL